MKKKSFFYGMVTMLLLVSLVGTASATVATVTKELEYRDISVTLDGEKLDLRDAHGNVVEPFMFEGTNYLPVRALAEALGLNVSWDSKTATVVLTTPEKVIEETTADKLIVAKESVRFYYTGVRKNEAGGVDIKIRCENDSDYKIFVYTREFKVNRKNLKYDDKTAAFTFDCTVEPGRHTDTAFSITKEALDAAGIIEINRFEMNFVAYDTENSGWGFETGVRQVDIN